MLGLLRKKNDGKFIHTGEWIDCVGRDKGFFRFSLENSTNFTKLDFNNLSGVSGTVVAKTRSSLKFKIDDVVKFNHSTYKIMAINEDLQESNTVRLNKTTYLTLRK